MLGLGLRPIELQLARWENVSWQERFLFIAKSHPSKMPQACQNQPIPMVVWPLFEERRRERGLIWTSAGGQPLTRYGLDRSRRSVQRAVGASFHRKRFRKTCATILGEAGNDVVVVSRLLRQSAGGKNVTMAERRTSGRSQRYLRDVVDEAFQGLSVSPTTTG